MPETAPEPYEDAGASSAINATDNSNGPRLADRRLAADLPLSEKAEGHGADGTQLVTFLLKDEEFGFDIMSVQEIIRLPKMARLPQTPDYVEGVSNLRGVLLPIVDIRTRFGMKRQEQTDRSRVLVIDIGGKRTGLLVDSVRQVTRVARNEFEPPPAAIRNETADYIDGVVKLDKGERIIIALDAERVCAFLAHDQIKDRRKEPRVRSTDRAVGGAPEAGGKPALDPRVKGGKVRKLVSFQVGREEFAFPMEHVREILRVQTPKEVPGAPAHLLGVLTVRGQILPIVDLRRLLRQNSFAADHIAEARHAIALYQDWLEQGGRAARQAEIHALTASSERLRRWLVAFSSSSQVLMEILARVRGSNEHVAKQSLAKAHEADSKVLDAAYGELTTAARSIVAGIQAFEEQAEANIREDQRIIVVDSNGFQLGLVVDHVNEVLGVPEEAIEDPPNLAPAEGISLSGIAKLNDGNRLILLLATGNLLDGHKLAEIAEAGGETGLAKMVAQAGKESSAARNGEEVQLVTFLLGKEEYGIPIAKIQEIDRLSNITQTPKAPKFVEGVTNLRGEVIPVLSTRTLFALEPRVSDDRTRVIIVDLGGAKTGLVVDSVKEVLSISSLNIAPPPASISNGMDGQFISGIGKVENGKRMIVLLDVGRVLTRGEQSELGALARPA